MLLNSLLYPGRDPLRYTALVKTSVYVEIDNYYVSPRSGVCVTESHLPKRPPCMKLCVQTVIQLRFWSLCHDLALIDSFTSANRHPAVFL